MWTRAHAPDTTKYSPCASATAAITTPTTLRSATSSRPAPLPDQCDRFRPSAHFMLLIDVDSVVVRFAGLLQVVCLVVFLLKDGFGTARGRPPLAALGRLPSVDARCSAACAWPRLQCPGAERRQRDGVCHASLLP